MGDATPTRTRLDEAIWNATAAAAVVAAALAGGCKVGPDYRPPTTPMPAAYEFPEVDPAAQTSTTNSEAADIARWWGAFNDPMLTSLIERAALGNLNVQIAETRIRQARASRGITASALYPQLNATAAALRQRSPLRLGNTTTGSTTDLFQAGLDASWEIDVFGGTRRAVESADANIQFAIEDRRDVLVTLSSEVALNYANLRSNQDELEVARRNLAIQERTADITRRKYAGGLTTRLDVANAEAQVATTKAVIPSLEAAARSDIYNLGILLGLEPTSLEEELLSVAPIPPVPPMVPAGLPSELLQRRPDIRRAEAALHSATAQVGVAVSDLFPKFALTGSLGLRSPQLSSLFDAESRFWTIGPAMSWSLFSGGRVRSTIALNKAKTDEAFLAYQQTVLVALRDVQVALESYGKEQERRAALVQSVDSNREAVELSTRLYAEGLTDFVNVLTAQRSLLAAEEALTLSTRDLTTDLVALYKALGGGWEAFEPQVATTDPAE